MTLPRWPFLKGAGFTARMCDCAERHHATTEPQDWEDRRVEALIVDLRAALDAERGRG